MRGQLAGNHFVYLISQPTNHAFHISKFNGGNVNITRHTESAKHSSPSSIVIKFRRDVSICTMHRMMTSDESRCCAFPHTCGKPGNVRLTHLDHQVRTYNTSKLPLYLGLLSPLSRAQFSKCCTKRVQFQHCYGIPSSFFGCRSFSGKCQFHNIPQAG